MCGGTSLLQFGVVFSPVEVRHVAERRKRVGFGQTLEDRCLEFAIAYDLSPHELKVFRHLARGRSLAFFQEEPGIAEDTVKVHARDPASGKSTGRGEIGGRPRLPSSMTRQRMGQGGFRNLKTLSSACRPFLRPLTRRKRYNSPAM